MFQLKVFVATYGDFANDYLPSQGSDEIYNRIRSKVLRFSASRIQRSSEAFIVIQGMARKPKKLLKIIYSIL